MSEINLTGTWRNKEGNLEIIFKEKDYLYYVNKIDGEKRGKGTYGIKKVEDGNFWLIEFSDYPTGLYLWMFFPDGDIMLMDMGGHKATLKKIM